MNHLQKRLYLSPANNEACISGNVLSASESTIIFKWNKSDHTDSYDLTVKNLENNTVIQLTTQNTELAINLLRNNPYSWFITSKSTKTTNITKSEIWKFYNVGTGVGAHAPFPAEAVSPLVGQRISSNNGTITLDWNATDVDNDLKSYEIYMGTTTSPVLIKSNHTESMLSNLPVNANTTYYWKIKTIDDKGNSSDSELFIFYTN